MGWVWQFCSKGGSAGAGGVGWTWGSSWYWYFGSDLGLVGMMVLRSISICLRSCSYFSFYFCDLQMLTEGYNFILAIFLHKQDFRWKIGRVGKYFNN